MDGYHKPVLADSCIEALNIKPDGVYVDVTYGGGSHSTLILQQLSTKGKLFAFDRDGDAIAHSEQHPQLQLIHEDFRHTKRFLRLHGIRKIDGLLADLGVSSHQFDQAERGFSTRFEGPLDSRMDQRDSLTMGDVLNTYSLEELTACLKTYGELKNAYKVAQAIDKHRQKELFTNTKELITLLSGLAPKQKENKFYAQVFQALRIEVNGEMKALDELLRQSADIMNTDGRLVVLSYHSLEDRMVKNYIRSGNAKGEIEKDFYGNVLKPWEAINRKPIIASEEEINHNSRARSAKLRIAKRTKFNL